MTEGTVQINVKKMFQVSNFNSAYHIIYKCISSFYIKRSLVIYNEKLIPRRNIDHEDLIHVSLASSNTYF